MEDIHSVRYFAVRYNPRRAMSLMHFAHAQKRAIPEEVGGGCPYPALRRLPVNLRKYSRLLVDLRPKSDMVRNDRPGPAISPIALSATKDDLAFSCQNNETMLAGTRNLIHREIYLSRKSRAAREVDSSALFAF
jgi:hypothetical protein